MLRIVERDQDYFEFKQGVSSGALMGPMIIGTAGVLAVWEVVGWQVLSMMLCIALWILFVYGDMTHVVLDRQKNLVRVTRRRFLRGESDDVVPLDTVTGVFVGRKAVAFFASAIFLKAIDDVRITGFQHSRWGLVFFSSQLAAFLSVPCVSPGKLDPIGKIARGEVHPLDRLLGGSKESERDPWERSEHPLDRLVPHRETKPREGEAAADNDPPKPDRGPDGNPVQ